MFEAHQQPIQGFLSGCPPIWDQESVQGWKIFHLPAGSTLVFIASEPEWVFQILVSVNQVSSELTTVHIWKAPAVRLRTQEPLGRGSTTLIFTLKKHFGKDFPEVILVDELGTTGWTSEGDSESRLVRVKNNRPRDVKHCECWMVKQEAEKGWDTLVPFWTTFTLLMIMVSA